MKILVNNQVFDSTETPIVIEFHENEEKLFNGMKKYVSAPHDYTEEQRQELINIDLNNVIPNRVQVKIVSNHGAYNICKFTMNSGGSDD